MKIHLIPVVLIALLTGMIASLNSVHAQTIAIQDAQYFNGPGGGGVKSFDGNIGFQFSLDIDAALDSLGLFDANPTVSNGTTQEVGLFGASGLLLAEGDVTFGSSQAQYTFAFSTSPLAYSNGFSGTLTSGTTYEVGSLAGGSASGGVPYLDDRSNTFTPGVDLTVISSVYNTSSTFSAPTTQFQAGKAYLGPNFTYSAVPEPASFALLLAGLGALVGMLRLRRRKA